MINKLRNFSTIFSWTKIDLKNFTHKDIETDIRQALKQSTNKMVNKRWK